MSVIRECVFSGCTVCCMYSTCVCVCAYRLCSEYAIVMCICTCMREG